MPNQLPCCPCCHVVSCRVSLRDVGPVARQFRCQVLFAATKTEDNNFTMSPTVIMLSKLKDSDVRQQVAVPHSVMRCDAPPQWSRPPASVSGRSRGAWAPLAPKISSKSCSFKAILRGKTPILSNFWARGPLGVKTPLGPPDQNPGSAPECSVFKCQSD